MDARLHWALLAAVLAAVIPVATSHAGEASSHAAIGEIDRADSRFDALVSKDAVLEQLAEGFEWSEGPVWIRDGSYLLFSDIPNNAVMKWKQGVTADMYLCRIKTKTKGLGF